MAKASKRTAGAIEDEHIRVAAYHLWDKEGRPEGREQEYWDRAREQLSAGETGAKKPKAPARAKAEEKAKASAKTKAAKPSAAKKPAAVKKPATRKSAKADG